MRSTPSRAILSVSAISVLAGVGLLFLHQPHFESVVLSSGHRFDVLAVTRDRSIGGMLRRAPQSHQEAILVAYYSQQHDLDSPAASDEARELVELATPLVQRYNDSLVVTEPTATIGPRWSPFVRGRVHFFVRTGRDEWQEISP
jgi:hypothetical protein